MRTHPHQLIIHRTADGIDETIARLQRGPLAVDTETNGLDWTVHRVGALNLAAGNTAVCFIKDALRPAIRYLKQQIRDGRELVFHHAKFDLHMLRETANVNVAYPVHDTMIESFLLDNRGVRIIGNWKDRPHSLKPLSAMLLDPDAQDHETEMMKAIKRRAGRGAHKGMWHVLLDTEDEPLFTHYSAFDAWYTLQLHLDFYERIRCWQNPPEGDYDSLLECYRTEQWLILALRDMEHQGILADRLFLENFKEQQERAIKKAKKKLLRASGGRDINWNSNPQLAHLLYYEMGLLPQRWSKKTGAPSTDMLALLLMGHPIGEALIEYRKATKQLTTYAEALLEAMCDDTAIRATFNALVDTGRTSCSDPNLQQQARDSGIRKAFIAGTYAHQQGYTSARKKMKLRFADYSQLEMRLGAHFANEPTFIEGWRANDDFDPHAATGKRMYGVDEPTKQQRTWAKQMNFLSQYGGGRKKAGESLQRWMHDDPSAVFRALHEFGYSARPGEDPYTALGGLLLDRFGDAMPAVKVATREESAIAEARGYVMTTYGLHRFIEDDFYRAFNTKVQGTAGLLAKRGLVSVYRELQQRGDLYLLLFVHDELVYEHEGDPKVDRAVLELMEERSRFQVPIIADLAGSDTTWQDKQKIALKRR